MRAKEIAIGFVRFVGTLVGTVVAAAILGAVIVAAIYSGTHEEELPPCEPSPTATARK